MIYPWNVQRQKYEIKKNNKYKFMVAILSMNACTVHRLVIINCFFHSEIQFRLYFIFFVVLFNHFSLFSLSLVQFPSLFNGDFSVCMNQICLISAIPELFYSINISLTHKTKNKHFSWWCISKNGYKIIKTVIKLRMRASKNYSLYYIFSTRIH